MDTGWMTSAEVKKLYHMNPDKWSGLFVEEIVTRLPESFGSKAPAFRHGFLLTSPT